MLDKNSVFSWQDVDYRLLGVVADTAILFPLASKKLEVTKVAASSLEAALKNGTAVPKADPYAKLQLSVPQGKALEKMRFNCEMLRPALELEDELIISDKARSRALNEIGSGDASKRRRAVRLLASYWRKGQCETALVPEYGRNTNPRNCTRKPGRRFADARICPPPLDDELRKIFKMHVDKYILKENGLSLAKTYAILVTNYLQSHTGTTEETAPSINQFRYFYRNYKRFPERLQAKTGDIEYNKDKRALRSSIYTVSDGIGRIYEIDSTLADVYLVSEADRTELIGRPTLYVVTDVYSRMIVGMHITVEASQFASAAEALVCAMSDKRMCEAWSGEFKADDWPVSGLPHSIVADNGELAGRQIEFFSRSCSVWINNTQAYRGDRKSSVERAIGLLQDRIGSLIEAHPEKVVLKKEGAKDLRSLASLTLKDYRQMVLNAVVDVNNRVLDNVPPGYPLRAAPTPIAIWKWCMTPGGGRSYLQKRFGEEQLHRALLPRFAATVSRRGITAEQLTYHCEKAFELGWMERDRHAPRPQEPYLSIDPNNVSRAWLFESADTNPEDAWPCTLSEQCAEYEGKPLFEARFMRKVRTQARQEAERRQLVVQGKTYLKNAGIAKKAKNETPESLESNVQRMQAIADNRRRERQRIAAEKNSEKGAAGERPTKLRIAEPNPFAYPDDFENLDN